MPDRSVTGDDFWVDHTPKPRIAVAISEDRRVMVALAPIAEMADGTFLWHTYEWSEEYDSLVETDTYYLDDGDSADDILRRHLFELQMRKAR